MAAAAAKAAKATGVDIVAHRVGRGGEVGVLLVANGDRSLFETSYGIGPTDASLVRPDGYVAWRSPTVTEYASQRLATVLAAVLCREPR